MPAKKAVIQKDGMTEMSKLQSIFRNWQIGADIIFLKKQT